MKFQFDLLPAEYKSLPRDNIGIALAILVIITTIAAVGSMSIKNSKELAAVDGRLNGKDAELRDIIDKTGKLQPPVNEINALRSSIEFINSNLDTPASNMVDFLASFEAAVPDRVLINDISPKNFSNLAAPFSVTGEGATIQDVLEFVNRLNQSGKFRAQLKSNTSITVENGQAQKFMLDLAYTPTVRK
ncbi:MAG: hypothetical protein PHD82_03390 [Candidatus Riflebacteria bacterium]|nr:hypothetical protein [Candidatus Riflebacteria bacterium]